MILKSSLLSLFIMTSSASGPREVPPVEVRLLEGGVTMLRHLQGPSGTVVVARDSACARLSEAETLRALEKQYESQGIRFIYIYMGQGADAESLQKEKESSRLNGKIIINRNESLTAALGLRGPGDAVVIDKLGQAVALVPFDQIADRLSNLAGTNKIDFFLGESPRCSFAKAKPPSHGAGPLTFNRDVYPIFESRCIECHRTGKSFIDLSDYQTVRAKAQTIRQVLIKKLMPPWKMKSHLGPWVNDLSLAAHEEETILKWIDGGLIEGSGRPHKTVAWKNTWSLGKPDAIVRIPKPVKVPAQGEMDYQHFVVDSPFKKDVWVKGFEVLAAPVVVHHVLYHVLKDPKELRPERFPYNFVSRFGWALGNPAGLFQPNVGSIIPRGSKIAITVHYQPNGKATVDNQTQVGFYLHDGKPEYERQEWPMVEEKLVVPAGAQDHVVVVKQKVEADTYLIALNSHMHLRGKKSKIQVRHPSGETETLLDVDPYNFNHQFVYQYQKPKRLMKGDTVECINHFDNSSKNPVNPDATQTVRWGEKTTDEMSICSVYYYTK